LAASGGVGVWQNAVAYMLAAAWQASKARCSAAKRRAYVGGRRRRAGGGRGGNRVIYAKAAACSRGC